MLTEREKSLIGFAAIDIATGHHLVYDRTEEELAMLTEVCWAIDRPEEQKTEREKEICEEYRLCTDYEYWKSKQTN